MKILDNVRQHLTELKAECSQVANHLTVSGSTYVVGGRKECWFEKGWTLNQQTSVFDAPSHKLFYDLGQKYFPGNDACLFLYYPQGSYIREHRDHKVSENQVVQINLGCNVIFTLNKRQYYVRDGDVISFDSKQLHSVSPATKKRFVISWRKIKPSYLQQQLSLF